MVWEYDSCEVDYARITTRYLGGPYRGRTYVVSANCESEVKTFFATLKTFRFTLSSGIPSLCKRRCSCFRW